MEKGWWNCWEHGVYCRNQPHLLQQQTKPRWFVRPRSAHSTRVKGDNKYTLLENINLIQILLLLFKTLCISRQFYLQLIREFPSTNSPEDNYNLDKICLKKKKTTRRCRRERKVRQILEGSWHWRERRYLVNFLTYDSYPEGRPQSQGITPLHLSQEVIPRVHPWCPSLLRSLQLFISLPELQFVPAGHKGEQVFFLGFFLRISRGPVCEVPGMSWFGEWLLFVCLFVLTLLPTFLLWFTWNLVTNSQFLRYSLADTLPFSLRLPSWIIFL